MFLFIFHLLILGDQSDNKYKDEDQGQRDSGKSKTLPGFGFVRLSAYCIHKKKRRRIGPCPGFFFRF
jgi:hypothetical protein